MERNSEERGIRRKRPQSRLKDTRHMCWKTEGKARELTRERLSGTTRENGHRWEPQGDHTLKNKLLRITRVSFPIIKRHRKPAGSPTIWLLALAQQERPKRHQSPGAEGPPGYCWCVLLLAKALHPSPKSKVLSLTQTPSPGLLQTGAFSK